MTESLITILLRARFFFLWIQRLLPVLIALLYKLLGVVQRATVLFAVLWNAWTPDSLYAWLHTTEILFPLLQALWLGKMDSGDVKAISWCRKWGGPIFFANPFHCATFLLNGSKSFKTDSWFAQQLGRIDVRLSDAKKRVHLKTQPSVHPERLAFSAGETREGSARIPPAALRLRLHQQPVVRM